MSNQYPTLTVTEKVVPNIERFIQKTAQLALQLDMIKMTGVGDDVTLTLLPSKILLVEVPLDDGSLLISTELVDRPDWLTHPFTLSTDDYKVIVTGDNPSHLYHRGVVREINDFILMLIKVFIQSRDNEIGKIPERVSLGGIPGGHMPYPMDSTFGFQPQQYPQSQHPHPNQPHPQQPQAGYPMDYGPWGPQPRHPGPVGPSCGYAGDTPIKQGYTKDDDSLLEGRNEKPGG